MWWPLMQTAITSSDKKALVDFINGSDRYTCGEMVKKFEDDWSVWLNCKYSLFVTSGSTANLLLLAAVKELFTIPNGSKVLVPACTWVTNVSPVFQLGLEPVFCDVDLERYSFDIDKLPDEDIRIVFVTHLLGLNAPLEKLKERYPNAIFLEDICESHGVRGPDGTKRGSIGTGSTFSFYYGHHMTTIEGGMISTDNELLYELMKVKRSHGMARLLSPRYYEEAVRKHPNIDPSFLFITDGYNFRNTELNAVIGIEQLKRLDATIEMRRDNFKFFVEHLDPDLFYIPWDDPGNSSFAFPFVCKKREDMLRLKTLFTELGVEYRPIVSGNLLLHPFLEKWKGSVDVPNANLLNDNGVYISNNQFVTKEMLLILFEAITVKKEKVAIVTGASGQDGSYLCELLREKGYHVRPFIGDIVDGSNIRTLLALCKPYARIEIYNLAAKYHIGTPLETLQVNTIGILTLLEAVKDMNMGDKCKIFQASSSEIFGNTTIIPQTETTPFQPRSVYGISKMAGHALIKQYREMYGLYACSGILYNHESPRRGNIYVTQKIIKGLQSGNCFQIGNIESRRDWGHAKDYVEAMWLMLQQDKPDDYIIATGQTHSVREFIDIAVSMMGKQITWSGGEGMIDGVVAVNVSKELYRPNDGNTLVGDPSKIESIGWVRKYTLLDIIKEMITTI